MVRPAGAAAEEEVDFLGLMRMDASHRLGIRQSVNVDGGRWVSFGRACRENEIELDTAMTHTMPSIGTSPTKVSTWNAHLAVVLPVVKLKLLPG